MKHLKHILKHLLILSILIIGCFIPAVWLALIFIVIFNQDQSRKAHNHTILKQPQPVVVKPHIPPYTTFDKQTYLKSPQWQTLRKAVLKRDLYVCQSCKSSGVPLEVHHITYTRLGNELLSDLVSVCRDCHQSIHDQYGYDYSNTYPISS